MKAQEAKLLSREQSIRKLQEKIKTIRDAIESAALCGDTYLVVYEVSPFIMNDICNIFLAEGYKLTSVNDTLLIDCN